MTATSNIKFSKYSTYCLFLFINRVATFPVPEETESEELRLNYYCCLFTDMTETCFSKYCWLLVSSIKKKLYDVKNRTCNMSEARGADV